MDDDWKWFIGITVTVTAAFATTLIAAFRNLAGRITASNRALHQRIDEVKDTYVRRDDLDGHILRLENSVRDLREEMREQHRQLLEAITRDR